jgi:hypothetical protein
MNRSFVSSLIDSSDDMHPDTVRQNSHVTINEQIILTRDQYELLKIISNTSNKSVSEYIQKALI